MNNQEKRELLLALKDFDEKLTHFAVTDTVDFMGIVWVETHTLNEFQHLINEIQPFNGLIIHDFLIDEVLSDMESEQRFVKILLTNNAQEYMGCDIDNELKELDKDLDNETKNTPTDTDIDGMLEDKIKEYFGDYYDNFDEDTINNLKRVVVEIWAIYKDYLSGKYLTNYDYEYLYENKILDTLYAHCDICGEVYEVSDMHNGVNGGNYDHICNCCYDGGFTCDRCGEWIPQDGDYYRVNTNYGEEYWCNCCGENHAFYCEGYDEYFSDYDYNSYEVNDRLYSESYCDNHFYWCDECQSYVESDDWDCDYECCRWCAEDNHYSGSNDRVMGYHDRPDQYLYGKISKNKKSYYGHIGIELEIDKDNHNSESDLLYDLQPCYDTENHELYFNHDGSLNCGFEIITQPHTYKAFKNMQWKEILQKCIDYGYRSHDTSTCGLHMHISRDLLGATKDKQDRAITKLMMFIDANWNDIVKVSRRKDGELNHWASRCRDYGTNKENYAKKNAMEDYKKNAKNKYAFGRYMALNNTNYDTVEFRFMKGTLKYESFMACIDFLYRIAMNSKNIKYKDILNNKLWLKGISENTKAYLKERNAFLDAISE